MPTETSSADSNPNLVRQVTFEPEPPKPLIPSAKPEHIVNTEPLEPPIQTYEERHGRPLLVDILDIAQLYKKSDHKQDDTIKSVDEFLIQELVDRGYKATQESYKALLEEMKAKSNITDLHDYDEQLRKLSIYIEAMTKQKEVKAALELLNGTAN